MVSDSNGDVRISTIHISNIGVRNPTQEIRRNLYALCSTFGKVLLISYTKSRGRGSHAFVAYADNEAASEAVTELNGMMFLNRVIHVELARKLSDISSSIIGKDYASKFQIQRAMEVE